MFKIKYKDKTYLVNAATLKEAVYKFSDYVNKIECRDGTSPQTYIKLKEKGYTSEDWQNWSDDEKLRRSHEGETTEKQAEKPAEKATEKTEQVTEKPISENGFKVTTDAKAFSNALHTAREELGKIKPEAVWRVDEQSPENLADAELVVSDNGSTFAIRPDGDIIAVCRAGEDKGYKIIQEAVKHGGDRLDSFSGNNQFYMMNGFEPVCYIDFNPEYAPPDWNPKQDDAEEVVFYQYTGNMRDKKDVADWTKIKATLPHISGDDYDAAYKYRDEVLKNAKSI